MTYAPEAVFVATPIGPVRIESDGILLTAIRIEPPEAHLDSVSVERNASPVLRKAAEQLRAYFDGRLTRFDLPLKPSRTPRGADLRRAMEGVGFGQVATYGALAEAIGSSARAIGQACRTNAFPILVPCHRILSAGQRLGFYSAGDGPGTKQRLLQHEGATGWRA